MNRNETICLLLILIVGWGGAAAIAYTTDRPGLAALVFVATLAVFAYWPLRRRDK